MKEESIIVPGPDGDFLLSASQEGLTRLQFPGTFDPAPLSSRASSPLLVEAQQQWSQFWHRQRTHFDLPLDLRGTPFQLKVWAALRNIPFNQTRSYGDIARTILSPRAARAVGMACHRNPLPIFVPCHRVLGANGSLTGFAPGILWKNKLLLWENSSI